MPRIIWKNEEEEREGEIIRLKDRIKSLEAKNSFMEYCDECGAVYSKRKMHEVVVGRGYMFGTLGERKYYCPEHKKPYDNKKTLFGKTIFSRKEVEVDEKGKEIKK